MDVKQLLTNADAYQLYTRFIEVLQRDGERVFKAYMDLFRRGDFEIEDLKLSQKEIIAIAERALNQYKYIEL